MKTDWPFPQVRALACRLLVLPFTSRLAALAHSREWNVLVVISWQGP